MPAGRGGGVGEGAGEEGDGEEGERGRETRRQEEREEQRAEPTGDIRCSSPETRGGSLFCGSTARACC